MGKQSVESDSDPQTRHYVHTQQQAEIDPTEAPAPQRNDDGHKPQKRQDDDHEVRHSHASRNGRELNFARRQL